MLTDLFIFVVVVVAVIIFFYALGEEFRKRTKEIIQIYDLHEKYLIKDSVWNTTITYPKSEFYVITFKDAKELSEQITIMISDAIKCFNQQNVFTQLMTDNLLIDLHSIRRKLLIIYTMTN